MITRRGFISSSVNTIGSMAMGTVLRKHDALSEDVLSDVEIGIDDYIIDFQDLLNSLMQEKLRLEPADWKAVSTELLKRLRAVQDSPGIGIPAYRKLKSPILEIQRSLDVFENYRNEDIDARERIRGKFDRFRRDRSLTEDELVSIADYYSRDRNYVFDFRTDLLLDMVYLQSRRVQDTVESAVRMLSRDRDVPNSSELFSSVQSPQMLSAIKHVENYLNEFSFATMRSNYMASYNRIQRQLIDSYDEVVLVAVVGEDLSSEARVTLDPATPPKKTDTTRAVLLKMIQVVEDLLTLDYDQERLVSFKNYLTAVVEGAEVTDSPRTQASATCDNFTVKGLTASHLASTQSNLEDLYIGIRRWHAWRVDYFWLPPVILKPLDVQASWIADRLRNVPWILRSEYRSLLPGLRSDRQAREDFYLNLATYVMTGDKSILDKIK